MASQDATQDKEYRKAYRNYLKSKQPETGESTAFRVEEKKYKSKFPNPDLNDVLDIWMVDDSLRSQAVLGDRWKSSGTSGRCATSVCINTASGRHDQKAWILPSHPGLVIVPKYLDEVEQRSLIKSCLGDQARSPNETNLDTHYVVPENGIWNYSRDNPTTGPTSSLIHPKVSPGGGSGFRSAPPTKRSLINNDPGSLSDLSKQTPLPALEPSPNLVPVPAAQLLPKLRWANIGRSYHWGSKSYDFSKTLAPFPEDIKNMCQRAVKLINWSDVWGPHSVAANSGIELTEWGEEGMDWESWPESYTPDAGIVNFYQLKDTLMGHVDRSELSATTPLVSISLGHAAIFLIGGATRDEKPTPILLRSGDVLIMSGPRCRRAYHGVPRILEGTLPEHLRALPPGSEEANDWEPFAEYLKTARLNVNVRQVFPNGFVPPVHM